MYSIQFRNYFTIHCINYCSEKNKLTTLIFYTYINHDMLWLKGGKNHYIKKNILQSKFIETSLRINTIPIPKKSMEHFFKNS